jgi:hypothetical protein
MRGAAQDGDEREIALLDHCAVLGQKVPEVALGFA